MRLNKWLAYHARISRRQADEAIKNNEVKVNGQVAQLGLSVNLSDKVSWRGQQISGNTKATYILMNKPLGFICSQNPQGKSTVYELLPKEYQHLKIAGRLDHDSCGLLLLTDDGDYIFQLTHPRFAKQKLYHATLSHALTPTDLKATNSDIKLDDGPSKMQVSALDTPKAYQIIMREGRNRQIRRTFAALGYKVVHLERLELGVHKLGNLKPGEYRAIDVNKD